MVIKSSKGVGVAFRRRWERLYSGCASLEEIVSASCLSKQQIPRKLSEQRMQHLADMRDIQVTGRREREHEAA